MRSLLKIVVILFCVQRGEGRFLSSLIGQRQEAASPRTSPNDDNKSSKDEAAGDGTTEASGFGSSPDPVVPILARSPRSAPEVPCGLRSVLLQVRDLGLGYDSDETVLFKYCSGSCPHMRSNHDLTLNNLRLSGLLPQPVPSELLHNPPCCRPSDYEDMAFLDNSHRWHKVEKLSAAGCSCVG